jgi:FkbM family methyltransferase
MRTAAVLAFSGLAKSVYFIRRALRASLLRLNRSGTRWAYAWIMSVLATWRRRELWWVEYRDGFWLHHTRHVVIPWPDAHAPHPARWDDETLDYFCCEYIPKPGDTVVDVGAGIGSEIPTWVRLTDCNGRIIAIEAHPTSYARLAALVEVNGYNVSLVQAAVADRAGTLTISDVENVDLNTIVGVDLGPQVAALTLDDILAEEGVGRIDLLKMNIEGAERLAVRGMTASIRNTNHAVIACHDFIADAESRPELRTKDAVRRFLIDNGFTVLERTQDGRPWVADYLYATRDPARLSLPG